jgi:hypothetical protein
MRKQIKLIYTFSEALKSSFTAARLLGKSRKLFLHLCSIMTTHIFWLQFCELNRFLQQWYIKCRKIIPTLWLQKKNNNFLQDNHILLFRVLAVAILDLFSPITKSHCVNKNKSWRPIAWAIACRNQTCTTRHFSFQQTQQNTPIAYRAIGGLGRVFSLDKTKRDFRARHNGIQNCK